METGAALDQFAFAIDNNVGNATYCKNLAKFLVGNSDFDATFFKVDLVADDIWQLIPIIKSNFALSASARAAASLYSFRRRKQIRAALIHSQSLGLFSIDFMRRTPTLISSDATPANFDTIGEWYGHKSYSGRVERIKNFWNRAAIRAAKGLLGWSKWVTSSYVNDYGVDPARTVVIPPGVDINYWKPDLELRNNSKKSNPKIKILFTGGDFRRKGGDILLKWVRQTKHREIEVHFVTREPVPETPNVFVHHGVSANALALVQLAQQCDIFALPTRSDCFSVAGIEAAATGLPLVMTDVGGISEIVDDGTNGYLCPNNDETAFFERLDSLVSDESARLRMGLAARKIAEERFDGRRNAEAVVAKMREISSH